MENNSISESGGCPKLGDYVKGFWLLYEFSSYLQYTGKHHVHLLLIVLTFLKYRDDTSGEDAEDKEPAVAFKGRRTANSQGRRKGRITRSMTSEVEETTTPPLNNELGQSQLHCTEMVPTCFSVQCYFNIILNWICGYRLSAYCNMMRWSGSALWNNRHHKKHYLFFVFIVRVVRLFIIPYCRTDSLHLWPSYSLPFHTTRVHCCTFCLHLLILFQSCTTVYLSEKDM